MVERKENYEKAIIQAHALKIKVAAVFDIPRIKNSMLFFLFLITELNYMSIHATSLFQVNITLSVHFELFMGNFLHISKEKYANKHFKTET